MEFTVIIVNSISIKITNISRMQLQEGFFFSVSTKFIVL